MENENLIDFLKSRSKSPLSDVISSDSRTVPEVEVPEREHEPIDAVDLQNGDDRRKYVDDDDEEPDRYLSAEEIDAMAESKAAKWSIGTSLLANGINAGLLLTPREWQIYYDWKERELDNPESLPIASPTISRILRKVQKLEASKDENALSTEEQKMLKKAIKAELKVQNKLGKLKRSGVLGTAFDILIAKAAPGVTEGVLRAVNALMTKLTGQR